MYFSLFYPPFSAQYLLAHNIHALSYHAGLNDSLRQTIHMRWINNECQVRSIGNSMNITQEDRFFRLSVQQWHSEWVSTRIMFVLLYIFLSRNQLKYDT